MSLRIVLDTNVVLVSVSSRSPYHWFFQALIEEQYELLVSTAILLEDEEIIERMLSRQAANNVLGVMIEVPNVLWVEPHYHWHLIEADPEDNKFVDCAKAGGADFVVTYDQHFNVLREIAFPSLAVVTPDEFRDLLVQPS